MLRHHGFRMELHSVNRMFAMAYSVNLFGIVYRAGDDLQRRWQGAALDDERVIAHDLQRGWQSAEDAIAVVRDP